MTMLAPATAGALFAAPLALLLAACGGSKAEQDPSACRAACEHMIELGLADIEKNGKLMGEDGAEIVAALKAQANATRASDLRTCQGQCQAGKLDTRCAMQARSIDGAMSCSRAGGGASGLTPVEPPDMRSDDDWPKATRGEVTDQVGGVTFSLRLPAVLQEQEADRSEHQRGWDFPGYPFSQPRFRVAIEDEFPATEAAALAFYDLDDDAVVLRKEHEGDRFLLLYRAKTFIVAQVLIRAGDKAIECYGTHSGSQLTKPEVIGPWLLDVCSTLTVRP